MATECPKIDKFKQILILNKDNILINDFVKKYNVFVETPLPTEPQIYIKSLLFFNFYFILFLFELKHTSEIKNIELVKKYQEILTLFKDIFDCEYIHTKKLGINSYTSLFTEITTTNIIEDISILTENILSIIINKFIISNGDFNNYLREYLLKDYIKYNDYISLFMEKHSPVISRQKQREFISSQQHNATFLQLLQQKKQQP
jgi:hypothetical protein